MVEGKDHTQLFPFSFPYQIMVQTNFGVGICVRATSRITEGSCFSLIFKVGMTSNQFVYLGI